MNHDARESTTTDDDLIRKYQEPYPEIYPRKTWWNKSIGPQVLFYTLAPFVLASYGVIALIAFALVGSNRAVRFVSRALNR